ncbi:serine/threonine-protein kinase [Streptomyces hilarionis]|uniref:serine/threonine-protein kinase n=1 Tax=Streptomyces hilarionis TaxID=2839954 RepID=UPI002119BBB5|nr:serine/threonine-protein kinase [Streptomyces hilarionis]MCQ9131866.1 serine/threonine protein kinase [Streptomyces hilarionis]
MESLESTDPATIGGYPLLARLGAGGMGQVYLSRTPTGRPLALKTVRPDLVAAPDFERRFAREIRTSDRVRSPWTVSVVDFSPPGHRPLWLATEYVAAPALSDWVAVHGPLPAAAVRTLAAELAAALAAVHACGLTHRDVKPSNVLLGRDRPMLIDFGIARAAHDSRHTSTGGVIGSPGYLAPEQAAGGAVTEAGDLFSLGAVLVYAATGTGPFEYPGEQPSAASLLYRIVHEPPRLDGVPAELAPLIRDCLAKRPEDRPDAAELAAGLRRRAVDDPRTAAHESRSAAVADAWKGALPPGLGVDLVAREEEVAHRCAVPLHGQGQAPSDAVKSAAGGNPPVPATARTMSLTPALDDASLAATYAPPPDIPAPIGQQAQDTPAPHGVFTPDIAQPHGPAAPAAGSAGFGPYGASALLHREGGARRRARWIVGALLAVAALVTGVVLWNPFGKETVDDGSTSSPTPSSSAPALSAAWAGVWTGTGPGNPDADGQQHPRTESFTVTLTLHTAEVGELAGKQVSNIEEAGTGREVGCTEALELRSVRGTTATFLAATSHATNRSDTSLQCESGHLYVVQLTAADTISLGEEGSQSAGAPTALHHSRATR